LKESFMAIRTFASILSGLVASLAVLVASDDAAAQSARSIDARAAAVIDYWTAERRDAAIPRDLVIDSRGLGYMRHPGSAGPLRAQHRGAGFPPGHT